MPLQDAAVSEEDMQQLLPALEEYTVSVEICHVCSSEEPKADLTCPPPCLQMNVAVRVSEVASSSSDGDDLLSTMILPEHVDDEVLSLRGQVRAATTLQIHVVAARTDVSPRVCMPCNHRTACGS